MFAGGGVLYGWFSVVREHMCLCDKTEETQDGLHPLLSQCVGGSSAAALFLPALTQNKGNQ